MFQCIYEAYFYFSLHSTCGPNCSPNCRPETVSYVSYDSDGKMIADSKVHGDISQCQAKIGKVSISEPNIKKSFKFWKLLSPFVHRIVPNHASNSVIPVVGARSEQFYFWVLMLKNSVSWRIMLNYFPCLYFICVFIL